MALQLPFNTPFGIELPEAYAKVTTGGFTKDYITFEVAYYANAAARDAGTPVVDRQAYQWNNDDMSMSSVTDADGLVAALYVYVKTLPGFEGASDV